MSKTKKNCRDCGNNTFYEGKMGNYVTVFPMDAFWTGMTSSNHVKVLICKKCKEINSMKVTDTLGFEEKEETIVYEKNTEESIVQDLVEKYKKRNGLRNSREITQNFAFDFVNELADYFVKRGLGNIHNLEIVTEDYLKFDYGHQRGYEEERDENILHNIPSSGWNIKAIEEVYHSKLPKGITVEKMNSYGDTGYHVWLKFNEKFFDAECVTGVSNLFELPFYKRFFTDKIKKQ